MRLTSIWATLILIAATVPVCAAEHGPRGTGRPSEWQPRGAHPSGGHGGAAHPPVNRAPNHPNVYRQNVVVTYNPWYSRYGSGVYNYGYPYGYGYNYPYGSSYDSGYDYPYNYGYGGYGYGYVPPLFIPADTLFGPGPVKRMMGVDGGVVPRTTARVVTPPPAPAPAARADPIEAAVKSDAAEAAMAKKFVDLGDAQFAAGKYLAASERYRRATATAPKAAKGFFHQAFTFLALEQYNAAVKAMKRGLSLDPAWPTSKFRLNELYGGDDVAKKTHLDALAQSAEANPQNGDLLFLVSVSLYFDGQAERAKPFFARAAQLTPGDHWHIDAFTGAK